MLQPFKPRIELMKPREPRNEAERKELESGFLSPFSKLWEPVLPTEYLPEGFWEDPENYVEIKIVP